MIAQPVRRQLPLQYLVPVLDFAPRGVLVVDGRRRNAQRRRQNSSRQLRILWLTRRGPADIVNRR